MSHQPNYGPTQYRHPGTQPAPSSRYKNMKKTLRVIGIIMIVAGIILVVFGLIKQSTPFSSSNWFAESSSGMIFTFAGSALIMFGFVMLFVSFIRRISGYYATETRPAIRTASSGFGTGIAEGIREGGGIKFDVNAQGSPREVVKVKCRSCGYLDSEDATFCSKCGSKL